MKNALTSLSGLLFILCTSLPVVAATSVEELSQLVREQEALQAKRDEYETSLRLLRASEATPGALLAVEEQIRETDLYMLELRERELQLRRELAGSSGDDDAPPIEMPDQDTMEVQRIRVLLGRYYAAEEQAEREGEQAGGSQGELPAEQTARSYSPGDVLLDGAESISALTDMNERLESESVMTSQRREVDIIYHIEVRGGGSLLSSKSYSLKALGRSQYIGLVRLPPGEAQISVKTAQWMTSLEAASEGDYLVTLSTPFDSDPELHLIPVQALLDTGWEDIPDWLPYIGAAPEA